MVNGRLTRVARRSEKLILSRGPKHLLPQASENKRQTWGETDGQKKGGEKERHPEGWEAAADRLKARDAKGKKSKEGEKREGG